MKFSQYGANEFSEVRYVREIKVVDYTPTAPASVYIAPGTIVLCVINEIVTAFNGTTPTTAVGDGTTTYQAAAAATAVGITLSNVPTAGAKKYLTGGTITVTVGGTSVTTGAGRLYVEMFKVDPSYREAMPPAVDWHPPML